MQSICPLVLTPEGKIDTWRELIKQTLQSGKNVIFVGDTETTGTSPKGDRVNKDLRDRVLEIAFLAYKAEGSILEEPLIDNDGTQIFFHEYINPFLEDQRILERYNSISYIPTEVLYVHGITESFLQGDSGKLDSGLHETNFRLKKTAPTFSDIKPYLERLCCLDLCNELAGRVCFLAHNASFDIEFLDCEWSKVELLHDGNTAPSSFESYFKPIDSLALIKEMYKTRDEIHLSMPPSMVVKLEEMAKEGKKLTVGYGLEFLRYFYEVDAIGRDVHGAMIDSVILAEVYKRMVMDPHYLELPIIKNLRNKPVVSTPVDINGLVVL